MLKHKMIAKKISFFVVSIMLLSSFVSAWVVVSNYWRPDNPLILRAGETQDVELGLQNLVESEGDITLKAELIGGSEIATITDSNLNYFVPSMTENVKVNLRVKIPEDASVGQKYEVQVKFTPIDEKEEGMVQIISTITRVIPVVVGEESVVQPPLPETTAPQKNYTNVVLLALGIVVLCVIIYLLLRKKDSKPVKRK